MVRRTRVCDIDIPATHAQHIFEPDLTDDWSSNFLIPTDILPGRSKNGYLLQGCCEVLGRRHALLTRTTTNFPVSIVLFEKRF